MLKPLCDRAAPFLSMPRSAYIIIAAALGALAFALIAQYGFDIQPCVLCLWQRVPFGVAAALAVVSLIGKPYGTRARILIALCALAFFIGAGLAFFHTGVERHWWEGTRGCAITPLHGKTIQDWKEQIMSAAVGHCDQIEWTFLGLSMANWNIPFSLGLALFALAAAIKSPSPAGGGGVKGRGNGYR